MVKLLEGNIVVKEGSATIEIPNPEKYRRPDGEFEPSWAPVFYNPKMEFNRDLSVSALLAYHKSLSPKDTLKGIDLLSGTGVRAIRYSLEVPRVEKIYANDKNPRAYELIKKNVKLNKLENVVFPINMDANYALLYVKEVLNEPILFIDIDPYGSPIPFIDNTLRVIGHRGLIGFTATDIAPLVGARIKACIRRYSSIPGKTPFSREMAIRILVGSIVRYAGVHEKGVKPLLVFYKDYYIRGFLLIERGASKADLSMSNIGYIGYSSSTGYVTFIKKLILDSIPVDPYTGKKLEIFGPLWLGPLADHNYVNQMIEAEQSFESHAHRDEIVNFLQQISLEYSISSNPPFRLDHCARILGGKMPRPKKVVEILREIGLNAVISYLDPQAVRTSADIRDIIYACREALNSKN